MEGSNSSTGKVFSFERAAMSGSEMPPDLNGAEQILFLGLRLLYRNYHAGAISREQASQEKAKMVNQYNFLSSKLKFWESSITMWARIERAASVYTHDRTIENADHFLEAVYNCKLKEGTP